MTEIKDQPVYYLVSNEVPDGQQLATNLLGDDGNQVDEFDNATDTIWNMSNFALRDLLAFLVQKWRIEDVMDSKIKAQNWDGLVKEFANYTEGKVAVSRPQIVRKWHNWKQYNKNKNKPHPFLVSGNLDEATIREKCRQLLEKIDSDYDESMLMAALESQQQNLSVIEEATGSTAVDQMTYKPPLARLTKLNKKDFLVRRTGASASALSVKRLEHEIDMEALNFEQERWRVKVENQKIVQQKIKYKLDIADVLIEKAELELKLKRQDAQAKGIHL